MFDRMKTRIGIVFLTGLLLLCVTSFEAFSQVDIYGANGSRVGRIDGNHIYDGSGNRLGRVTGSPVQVRTVALLSFHFIFLMIYY